MDSVQQDRGALISFFSGKSIKAVPYILGLEVISENNEPENHKYPVAAKNADD